MSMSTLGAQLAAINNNNNNNNNNIGSIVPTSRRHEDAIGRGLAHSVQVGHTLVQHTSKPSILYDNAKQAADVPITTLRENCITSLQQLQQQVDETFGSFIEPLCQKSSSSGTSSTTATATLGVVERGLLTKVENEQIDTTIQKLLYRLALYMGNATTKSKQPTSSSSFIISCGLHILEYLLRQYDLHLHSKIASTALLVLLPLHEEVYYLRLLQLIDLTTSTNNWSFLRPYAIPNAKLSRQVLSKQASKDMAFVKQLCGLVQENVQIMNNNNNNNASSTASSSSISFVAAILVEAMTLQLQTMGSMDESMCQTILPYCVLACKSTSTSTSSMNTANYIQYGHVLASTIVECCTLAMEPRQVLVTSVLQGIIGLGGGGGGGGKTKKNKNSNDHDDNDDDDDENTTTKNMMMNNGLLVALTILLQEPPMNSTTTSTNTNSNKKGQPSPEQYRLKVGTNNNNNNNSNNYLYYGFYTMDRSIFQFLCKIPNIVQRLGQLHSEYIEIRHFIASILTFGWNRIANANTTSTEKKDDTNKKSMITTTRMIHQRLLLEMIQNPTLQNDLWKDYHSGEEWIQSYVSYIVTHTSNDIMETTATTRTATTTTTLRDDDDFSSNLFQILNELKKLHPTAYEKGIVHALIRSKKDHRIRIAKWLGLTTKTKTKTSTKMESQTEKNDNDDNVDNDIDTALNENAMDVSIVLPPRVALEHADAIVRLEAIPRVLEELQQQQQQQLQKLSIFPNNNNNKEKQGDDNDDDDDDDTKMLLDDDDDDDDKENDDDDVVVNNDDDDDDFVSVQQALLRRFVSDDDIHVANTAGEALLGLIEQHKKNKNKDKNKKQHNHVRFLLEYYQDAIEALHNHNKWANNNEQQQQQQQQQQTEFLILALRICSYMAKQQQRQTLKIQKQKSTKHYNDNNDSLILVRLLESMACYLNETSSSKKVSQEAAKAIIFALKDEDDNDNGESSSSRIKDYEKLAKQLLVSNSTIHKNILQGFQRNWSTTTGSTSTKGTSGRFLQLEKNIRRRFMPILLQAFTEGQTTSKKHGTNDNDNDNDNDENNETMKHNQANAAIKYCSWAIKSFSHDMTTNEKEYLSECLLATSQNISVVPEQVLQLFQTLSANVNDETMFSQILAKFFKTVCDNMKIIPPQKQQKTTKKKKKDTANHHHHSIPGVAVLLEAALSSSSSSSLVINNLLHVVSLYTVESSLSTDETTESSSFSPFGFVPALALIAHADEKIRSKAIDIVCQMGSSITNVLSQKGSDNNNDTAVAAATTVAVLKEISDYISNNKSSAILGGPKFLSNLLIAVQQQQQQQHQKGSKKKKTMTTPTKKTLATTTTTTTASDDDFAVLKCLFSLCVCSVAAYVPTDLSSVFMSLSSTSTSTSDMLLNTEYTWLEVGKAVGGHNAALTILKAAELAGEAACPADIRWQYAGKPILEILLSSTFNEENVPPTLRVLIDEVALMLKGVKIIDPLSFQNDNTTSSKTKTMTTTTNSVIISSGPTSRGGRSRSYSFGKGDTFFHFMKPYPKDMQDSILSILSNIEKNALTRQLGNSLLSTILCSKSWGEHIFVGLPRAFILEVSHSVLIAAARNSLDGAEEAFFSLSLHAVELSDLLEKQSRDDDNDETSSSYASFCISYIADYINTNSSRLSNDVIGTRLFQVLFQCLEGLSSITTAANMDEDNNKNSNNKKGDDSTEFARQAVVEAILQLVQVLPEQLSLTSFVGSSKKLLEWISLLVNLVGSNASGEDDDDDSSSKNKSSSGSSSIRKLESIRSKRAIFQLLTSLCSRFPSVVVTKLIPAMKAIVAEATSLSSSTTTTTATSLKDAKMSTESLSIILPVYFQHVSSSSSTSMSSSHMINAFLKAVGSAETTVTNYEIRSALYKAFSNALGPSPSSKRIVGPFVTACIANEVYHHLSSSSSSSSSSGNKENNNNNSLEQLVGYILKQLPMETKLETLWVLVNYSRDILAKLARIDNNDGGGDDDSSSKSESNNVLSTKEIVSITVRGPQENDGDNTQLSAAANAVSSFDDQRAMSQLCKLMMTSVKDTIQMSPALRKYIRKIDGDEAVTPVLRFWQDLLLLQSCYNSSSSSSTPGPTQHDDDNNNSNLRASAASKHFWESIGKIINDSLSSLHSALPAHIFLAFATNLIKQEEGTGAGGSNNQELRARAIQLVAEGSTTVQPRDHEANLFREMIPFLSTMLDSSYSSSSSSGGGKNEILVRQSAFVAIESIIRLLCIPVANDSGDVKRHMKHFTTVLSKCTNVLEKESAALLSNDGGKESKNNRLRLRSMKSPVKQLVCSAALCTATTIRICGPRALAMLPKLIQSLVTMLSAANSTFCDISDSSSLSPSIVEKSEARVVQLSILRALCSLVESLPQFMAPHLGILFQNTAFPSSAIWNNEKDTRGEKNVEDDHQALSVKEQALKLEKALTLRVPARLLTPVASKSMLELKGDDDHHHELLSMLSVLTKSVQNSKGAELAPHLSLLVKAATYGYDHGGSISAAATTTTTTKNLDHLRVVFDASTGLLTTLILKLSEIQLRSLYLKLRDWRGEINTSNPSIFASRRVAFWSLSAGLAKTLKSIFLPCLSLVFSDAIGELEVATLALCKKRDSVKKADGKKKQRLEKSTKETTTSTLVEEGLFNHETLLSLQALLLCLENSLKSDAHNGGNWIRDNDSQRFHSLLEPLSKLLHCQITLPEISSSSSSLDYQSVIQGRGHNGDNYNAMDTGKSDDNNGSVVECLVALAAAAGDEQLWKPLNHAVLQACRSSSAFSNSENRSEVRKAGILCLHSLIQSIGEEYMVLIPECLPVLSELLEDSDEDIAGLAQNCISLSEELLGESLEDNL